jgi:hypothetical protein
MAKQARRQASRYCGSTARVTTERAHTRGGEDLDVGLHSTQAQAKEVAPLASHAGGQDEAATGARMRLPWPSP